MRTFSCYWSACMGFAVFRIWAVVVSVNAAFCAEQGGVANRGRDKLRTDWGRGVLLTVELGFHFQSWFLDIPRHGPPIFVPLSNLQAAAALSCALSLATFVLFADTLYAWFLLVSVFLPWLFVKNKNNRESKRETVLLWDWFPRFLKFFFKTLFFSFLFCVLCFSQVF